jgi:hypothetical protein
MGCRKVQQCVPDQPHKALGGSVLLCLELVADEVLDIGRLGGGGELALAEFLDIETKHVSR